MIHRDKYGIICQHDIYCLIVPEEFRPLDGGDSANRTGIMAMCGSKQDRELIFKFIVSGGFCRHPYQPQWADPKKSSRDQLVAYAAGLGTFSKYFAEMLVDKYKWHINKDILLPDVRGHLRRCAGKKTTWLQDLFLTLSILWSTKITPKEEQNQIICMVIMAGGKFKKLYIRLHPDIRGNLTEYWNGWRDQPEIGDALYEKLHQ